MNRNHSRRYSEILAEATYSTPVQDATPESIGEPDVSLGQGKAFALKKVQRKVDGQVVVIELRGANPANSRLWNEAVERWYPRSEWRWIDSCWLPESVAVAG